MSSNASYANMSWGGTDGDGFDIDFYNTEITVEYNYAHDNKGYCVFVFGSGNTATVNSVDCCNICANNNTSYWDSTIASTLETTSASFSGSNPNFFKNNLIYAGDPPRRL